MRELLEFRRSGITERVISGAIAIVEATAETAQNVGNPLIFGRSLTKPFQMKAVASVLDPLLDWREKALSLASHSGTHEHVQVAKQILGSISEDAFELKPSPPLDGHTSDASLWMNPCSGKHAAILVAARAKAWPLKGYTDLKHPYNQVYVARLESALGISLADRTVAPDGCFLPTIAMTTLELARLYSKIAEERKLDWVWEAAHRHPELIGGAGRLDTRYLQSSPDLFAKEGADGLFGLAVRMGSRSVGLVIKLAHGYDPISTDRLLRPLLAKLSFPLPELSPPAGQVVCFTDEYRNLLANLI